MVEYTSLVWMRCQFDSVRELKWPLGVMVAAPVSKAGPVRGVSSSLTGATSVVTRCLKLTVDDRYGMIGGSTPPIVAILGNSVVAARRFLCFQYWKLTATSLMLWVPLAEVRFLLPRLFY